MNGRSILHSYDAYLVKIYNIFTLYAIVNIHYCNYEFANYA
jgi:hypothetical protein